MTDTAALKELIGKRGLKLKYVAGRLGISAYGFALKLNNKQEFKAGEINILCKLLGITSLEEKESIFFKQKK